MKLIIDTNTQKIRAELSAKKRDGGWNVPLTRAILQETQVVTITHGIESAFHYFKWDKEKSVPTVEFGAMQHQLHDRDYIVARVQLSQDWLSSEIVRLEKLAADLNTIALYREAQRA